MNRNTLIGVIAGAVAVTALGAYATTHAMKDYATVISVAPAYDTNNVARQACRDEAVTQQAAVKDEKRIAGTAIGAVIGGVLGNQVGSGDGKKLATVAGAAAGGYAGNQVQKQMQEGNTETVLQQRCQTVYDSQKSQAGYVVTYVLDGKQGVVQMDHDPGRQIPVKDGALVLSN